MEEKLSTESALREILTTGDLPADFVVDYDDRHSLWGGTRLTARGDGRIVGHFIERGGIEPSEREISVEREKLRALVALLIEIEAWKQPTPARMPVAGESRATLKITAFGTESAIWESFNKMAQVDRLIRVKKELEAFLGIERAAAKLEDVAKVVADRSAPAADDPAAAVDAAVPQNYCAEKNYHGLTCAQTGLTLIRTLTDNKSEISEFQISVYRCRRCRNLYKYQRSARDTTYDFDNEAGWHEHFRYFKVDELYVQSIPLPFEEARQYGVQSAAPAQVSRTRCQNPPDFSGLTCRSWEVVGLGVFAAQGVKKCVRCGQFYKKVSLKHIGSAFYYHYRPGETYDGTVAFPLAEALECGYQPAPEIG